MNFRETIEEILLTENRIDFFKTQYVDTNKVTQKEFDAIIEGDPTPNKKYIGVYHEKINYLISSCIWQSRISLS